MKCKVALVLPTWPLITSCGYPSILLPATGLPSRRTVQVINRTSKALSEWAALSAYDQEVYAQHKKALAEKHKSATDKQRAILDEQVRHTAKGTYTEVGAFSWYFLDMRVYPDAICHTASSMANAFRETLRTFSVGDKTLVPKLVICLLNDSIHLRGESWRRSGRNSFESAKEKRNVSPLNYSNIRSLKNRKR